MSNALRAPWALILVGLLALPTATSVLIAQEETAEKDLPPAERIIEQMIAAEGGKAAMEAIKTRTIRGELEFVGQGMTATFTSWNGGAGKYRESMALTGFGDFEQGMLGEIAWAHDPIQGGRLLEGVEKDMNRRSSHISPLLHLDEDYAKMETVGRQEVLGNQCYVLKMTPKTGNPETWYVREDNLLTVRTEMTIEAPMVGKLTMKMDALDYQEVDGLRLPHRMELEQGVQKLTLKVTKYDHNAEIPDEKFILPPAVQKLVEKQKEGEAKPEGEAGKTPVPPAGRSGG